VTSACAAGGRTSATASSRTVLTVIGFRVGAAPAERAVIVRRP
jgi:hypothetical protein